jgi:hypothetical protein
MKIYTKDSIFKVLNVKLIQHFPLNKGMLLSLLCNYFGFAYKIGKVERYVCYHNEVVLSQPTCIINNRRSLFAAIQVCTHQSLNYAEQG